MISMLNAPSPCISPADVDAFARRFVACEIPKQEWTHAAHLTIGAWHVARYGPDEALGRLRAGIRKLNETHGTVNSATSGYHETITRAYVILLDQFLSRLEGFSFADRLKALSQSPLAARDVLFRFYARETLMSASARTGWIEPDLHPLQVSILSVGSASPGLSPRA